MCGRFTLTLPDVRYVTETFQATANPDAVTAWRPRYNIAPTQRHWQLTRMNHEPHLSLATWGHPGKNGLIINLRRETIDQNRYFRDQLAAHPVLVPADAFYEWHGTGKAKIPYLFRTPFPFFLFAAIAWQDEGSQRFALITDAAQGMISKFHHRMPVMLAPADALRWLDEPFEILQQPRLIELTATAVANRVNSTTNDDSACWAPPEPEPLNPQLGLF